MATVPELLDYVEHHTDLDVIAVTEHDTLRAGEEARELHARGAFRLRRRSAARKSPRSMAT